MGQKSRKRKEAKVGADLLRCPVALLYPRRKKRPMLCPGEKNGAEQVKRLQLRSGVRGVVFKGALRTVSSEVAAVSPSVSPGRGPRDRMRTRRRMGMVTIECGQ